MERDGNALLYHVSWTDSDVDGDGRKDALSFDIRVEGFEGSVVSGPLEGTVGGSYERKGRIKELNPQEPSATDPVTSMALGKTAAIPTFSDGNWGVGKDIDLDLGESLRFSVENIRLSSGSELNFDGFCLLSTGEPRAANSHVLVVGEGENVHVATANSPTHVTIPPTRTLLLTSARDSRVAAGRVVVKFVSRMQPETLGKDVEDYSTLPNGPYFRNTYPPQADQSNFPAWSWDRVPALGSVGNGSSDPEFIQAMASHHQIVNVGNTFKDGGFETAAALKKANPAIKILFYVNTGIFFGNYDGGLPVNQEWFKYTLNDEEDREDDMIRKYQSFNHSYPELRDWWARRAAEAAAHPAIDGIFVDKASDGSAELVDEDGKLTDGTGHVRSYVSLFHTRQRTPHHWQHAEKRTRRRQQRSDEHLQRILRGTLGKAEPV